MAIRLQQVYSALVHLPLMLPPLAARDDLVGRSGGNQSFLGFGRRAIELAALGALRAPFPIAAGCAKQHAVGDPTRTAQPSGAAKLGK